MSSEPSAPITFVQARNEQHLFEVAAVLAAGFIPINTDQFYSRDYRFVAVRIALMVISTIALAFSIFIYLVSILNIVNVLRMIPWLLIFLIIDVLTIVAFIILGCFACNQEALVPQSLYGIVYKRGLYAISGVFLFIAAILLLVHSYFVLVYLFRLDKFYSQTGPFDQVWRFNRNYCIALGWVRVLILVCLLCALLAAILVNVDSYEFYDVAATYYRTRTATIILTSSAIAYSGWFFLLSVCNCVNFRFFMAAPWLAIAILYDLIFMAAIITVGIFCALKESSIPFYDYNFVFRRGAYSVAALFEFLAAIFYLMHISMSFPYSIRVGRLPKKLSFIGLG